MKIISSLSDFCHWRKSLSKSTSIGFIPTMGALHNGHLSLVSDSLGDTDVTVVSIFVNPKQFSKNEDFDTYPRTLKDDLYKLRKLGVAVVFTPGVEDIYNESVESFSFEDPFLAILEGAARPHFFPGVLNVVSRLFNIVVPNFAYFGKKDAQQLLLIEKLVQLGGFSIKIIRGDTVREESGLAMSSRNQYLSSSAKQAASCLNLSLVCAKNLLLNGETNVNKIKERMYQIINKEGNVLVDYISIVCLDVLVEVESVVCGPVLISLAVTLDGVRLIDNVFYDSRSRPMSTL